jgi:hypothetical protein
LKNECIWVNLVAHPNCILMKKYLVLIPFLIIGFVSISSAQKKNDSAAIKALIEKETKAFFEIDYKTWADSWAQTSYAFWSFADTTDVNSFSGWDNISKGFGEYFRTAKPSKANIERNWLDIKIFGNGAYARFTQHVKDNTNRQPQAEVRVLEKINGQWKIVCVNVIAIEKNNEPKR